MTVRWTAPLIPSARLRLRGTCSFAFHAGEMRKKALRGFQGSPARLADKRPSRPASCQSPPPKAVPALGIHPASGTTSFFILKLRPMGHNASSILDYRGQFRVRKPKTNAIRSTPRMQSFSSDLSPQRYSGYVLDPVLTIRCTLLASTKSKRLTRTAASSALSEL